MRSSPVSTTRSAFTLLEMILAATIAVLLLGALYIAVNLQLQQAEAAREVVEQTTLARTIFTRITGDIAPDIGTADPTRYQPAAQPTSGGSGGSGGGMSGASGSGTAGTSGTGAAGTSGATTPATGGASASGSTPASGTTGSSSTTTTPTNNGTTAISGPNGLAVVVMQGTANSLTLFVSRVPPFQGPTNGPAPTAVVSDQHRIVYWLADGGGLARQEVTGVTSDDAQNQNVPSGTPDPNLRQLLAKEVRSLQFEYYDGTEWTDSWDGTQLGPDGVTPIGSPVAVAVTLGLAVPGTDTVKSYRHVVAILTANNPTPLQSTTAGSSGTSGGNGSSGTTSP